MSRNEFSISGFPGFSSLPLPDDGLLRQIVEFSSDRITLLDRQGRILWINAGGQCALEMDNPVAFISTEWAALWPDESHAKAQQAVLEALRAGVSRFQGYGPTLKGTPRWWDVTVTLLPASGESQACLVAVSHDISAQIEKDTVGARLEAVVSSSGDAIIGYDREGRITAWNGGAEQIFGWTAQEAIGQTYLLIGPPELHTSQRQIFTDTMHGKTGAQYVTKRKRKDGTVFDASVTTAPLRADGLIMGTSAAIRDISEEKQTAEILRQRTAMLDAIVQETGNAVLMKDAQGRYLLSNPACCRIIGKSPDDIIGRTDAELLDPATAASIMRDDAGIMRSGEGRTFEEEVPTDGVMRSYLSTKNPLFDAEGTVIGIIGISTDITERRQQAAQIVDLNTRLLRSMQETHHRVKNNLQVISALADMQAAEAGDTVPTTALLRIGQHVRSLALLHDLLTQQIRQEQNAEMISTSEVLGKLIPLLQSTTGGRPITCHAEDVPMSLEQGTAFTLLTSELISNAVKHGKGSIDITFACEPVLSNENERRNDPRLRLEICDDGPGFPDDFNAVTASNTGLELIDSLTRWDLRGKIFYKNRSEGGARVIVSFPLRREQAE